MSDKIIKMSNGQEMTLKLQSQKIKDHFDNPNNYTNAILDQFNHKNYYKNFLDENDKIIIDLGANIGLFAIFASPWADRIICVEPTPSHFKLLEELTSDFKNIERIECAVAPETGPIWFYTDYNNTTMNSLVYRNHEKFQVDGLTLEDIVKKYNLDRVDFVKMDIEGSEDLVLNEKTIEYIINNVPKILIEFHQNHDVVLPKFINIFTSNGYEVNNFNWDSLMCIKKKD